MEAKECSVNGVSCYGGLGLIVLQNSHIFVLQPSRAFLKTCLFLRCQCGNLPIKGHTFLRQNKDLTEIVNLFNRNVYLLLSKVIIDISVGISKYLEIIFVIMNACHQK